MPTVLQTTALEARARLGAKPRPGGPVCADMERLLPSFRAQVDGLLADMRSAGHEPRVFETWRSPERVAFLVAKGTGSASSMHPYGIAVDIICAVKLWKASAAFWRDLVRFAEARGLTCGARWRRRDLPHVQAIPVARQNAVRSKRGDAAAIDAIAKKALA